MMLTKIMAATLALFIAGLACFSGTPNDSQAQEPIQIEPANIYSADSSVKKTVDSTKCIREEFITRKKSLKEKLQLLLQQERRIRDNKKRIDSVANYQYLGYK